MPTFPPAFRIRFDDIFLLGTNSTLATVEREVNPFGENTFFEGKKKSSRRTLLDVEWLNALTPIFGGRT